MLTYNEVVDKLEQIDPDKITSDVQKQINDATEEIMTEVDEKLDEVDEKLANIKKLYLHNIRITSSPTNKNFTIFASIISDSNVALNRATFKSYLTGKGRFIATGLYYNSSENVNYAVVYIQDTTGVLLGVGFINSTGNVVSEDSINMNASDVNDTVSEL